MDHSIESRTLPLPVVAMSAPKPVSKLQRLFNGVAIGVKNAADVMLSCLYKEATIVVPSKICPQVMHLSLAPVQEVFAQEPMISLPSENEPIVSAENTTITSTNTSIASMKHYEGEDQDEDSSSDGSDSSDEDDDDDDDNSTLEWNIRGDLEAIEAIPEDRFQKVLAQCLSTVKGLDDLELGDIECVNIAKGSFNHVRIFEVKTETHTGKYAVKVPIAGTTAYWCDVDAQVLRSEAQTMMYIHKHTKVPIPEVIGFDGCLENELGAPFTVMTAIEGRPAYELFYETVHFKELDYSIWLKPDEPDAERKELRRTVLTSLAQAMAKLADLKFKHTGMLTFSDDDSQMENPMIVPAFYPKNPTLKGSPRALSPEQLRTAEAFIEYPVEDTVDDYFRKAFAKVFPVDKDATSEYKGERWAMSQILRYDPFWHDEEEDGEEYFVLQHCDLALHNVFVNDEGEVTGIIDWSSCRIVPRCLGYASLPRFLMNEWDYQMKGLQYDVKHEHHAPWRLDEYREMYASAMIAVTEDGKYTIKSAIYHAIDKALHYEGNCRWGCVNIVKGLLLQLPGTRFVDPSTLFELLEDGSETYELGWKYLSKEMHKLVATCEAPDW